MQATSFAELGLRPELLRAVEDAGYTTPTPIQVQAIPVVLSGRDLLGAAQTGTGKTAGFTLPLLQRLAPQATKSFSPAMHPVRALILTPTRELAIQVHESVRTYGKHVPLRSFVVYGGININPQIEELKKGVEILVATPGRLLDLIGQNRLCHLLDRKRLACARRTGEEQRARLRRPLQDAVEKGGARELRPGHVG